MHLCSKYGKAYQRPSRSCHRCKKFAKQPREYKAGASYDERYPTPPRHDPPYHGRYPETHPAQCSQRVASSGRRREPRGPPQHVAQREYEEQRNADEGYQRDQCTRRVLEPPVQGV